MTWVRFRISGWTVFLRASVVAAVVLAGVLQSLRDASDAGEQRFEQMIVGAVGFTPALQQLKKIGARGNCSGVTCIADNHLMRVWTTFGSFSRAMKRVCDGVLAHENRRLLWVESSQ